MTVKAPVTPMDIEGAVILITALDYGDLISRKIQPYHPQKVILPLEGLRLEIFRKNKYEYRNSKS